MGWFNNKVTCPDCRGSGKDYSNYAGNMNTVRCPKCDGYGCKYCERVDSHGNTYQSGSVTNYPPCDRCGGSGEVENKPERLF